MLCDAQVQFLEMKKPRPGATPQKRPAPVSNVEQSAEQSEKKIRENPE